MDQKTYKLKLSNRGTQALLVSFIFHLTNLFLHRSKQSLTPHPPHPLPRHHTSIIRKKLPIILPLQPMQGLQHPPYTNLRLQHRPLTPHPRLNPPGIHTNHHHFLQFLPQIPTLMYSEHIQRPLRNRIRRALARRNTERPLHTAQARGHVHDARAVRKQPSIYQFSNSRCGP